jgi:hypothetical protein
VLFFGRACEVSGASDGAEISQLMQFHSVYLSFGEGLESPARAAMCFTYEFHRIHILDLGIEKLYPRSLEG